MHCKVVSNTSWVKTTSRWFDPRIATVSVIHGLCFATAELRWLSRKQRALEESSETCPILEDTDLFFAIFLSPCPLQTLLNEHSCFLRTPSSPPCGSHYGYIFLLNHLCVCTCVHLCIFLQKLNPELTFSERQTQSVSSNCWTPSCNAGSVWILLLQSAAGRIVTVGVIVPLLMCSQTRVVPLVRLFFFFSNIFSFSSSSSPDSPSHLLLCTHLHSRQALSLSLFCEPSGYRSVHSMISSYTIAGFVLLRLYLCVWVFSLIVDSCVYLFVALECLTKVDLILMRSADLYKHTHALTDSLIFVVFFGLHIYSRGRRTWKWQL